MGVPPNFIHVNMGFSPEKGTPNLGQPHGRTKAERGNPPKRTLQALNASIKSSMVLAQHLKALGAAKDVLLMWNILDCGRVYTRDDMG